VRRLQLRDEGGFSLVFTMLTMLVTTVTLTAAIQYTTSNSRTSVRSKADQIAYSLAEAGLANGAAVLSKPSNNALDPNVLPSSEPDESNPAHANYIARYEGGTVKWWGVLTGHQWIMHGVGYVTDPTGKTQVVRREATSTIKIQPSLKQELNSNAWNFMFAKDTANACDVTLTNSVSVDTSLFILGDLCFENSSAVVKAADPDITNIYVGEHIQFAGSGSVGTAANKINQAQVGLGCRIGTSGAWTTPCSSATRVNATTILDGTLEGAGPTADFSFWYTNAKPGPTQACTTTTGTPPAFEGSPAGGLNNNAGTINLTPAASYSCKYYDIPPNDTDLLGELSWNNTTKKLTVRGAIYIDGSAVVSNNTVNEYDGLATLYLSGTFRIDGNAQLCGGIAASNCDFTAWDPNTDNLGIIANGDDGSGNSIVLANSARMQGSLYATKAVDVGSFAQYDGPMVAGTFKLANNIVTHEFPTINSVPVGWPGNPTVYAEPQPPQNYSG
jgi:Tfp pilus assembly protein PilV